MSKLLAKHSFIYVLIGVLPLAVNFLILPILTRYLSPDEFGELALIETFRATLATAACLQIFSGVNRLYFDFDKPGRRRYFSTLIIGIIVVGLIVCSLFVVMGDGAVDFIFNSAPSFYPTFLVATITIFFSLIIGVSTAFFRVEERPKSLLIISSLALVIGVLMSLFCLIHLNMGILGPVIGSCISAGITCILQLYVLRHLVIAKFDWGIFKENLLYGIPVIPHAMGGYLFMYSDKIILDKYVAISLIGIYAIADKFSMLLKLVVNAFAQAFMPVFTKACKQDVSHGQSLVFSSSKSWLPILALGYIFLCHVGEYLIYFMTPKAFHEAVFLVPILSLAYVFRGVYIYPTNSFYYDKKTKLLPIATLSSGAMNVLLNFLLIPFWGVYGAAITTVWSFLFNWIMLSYLTKNTFSTPVCRVSLTQLFIVVLASNLVFYLSIGIGATFRLAIQLIFICLFAGVLLWQSPISLKQLVSLIKRRVVS